MSKTFHHGLDLLVAIDVHGPLTVTELARLTDTDKSSVSRMLSACEPDGWIVRDNGRISLGPRAALLAHSSPAAEVIRQAEPLVEAVSGVTGLLCQIYTLVGSRAVVIASAGGGSQRVPVGLGTGTPLFATASGLMVAAQLEPEELSRRLPPDPFPDPIADMMSNPGYVMFATALSEVGQPVTSDRHAAVARDRSQLDAQLAEVRQAGFAADRGYLHAELSCIAVPWRRGSAPTAIAVMGWSRDVEDAEPLVRGVLAAAVAPDARREDVVAAAAAVTAAAR